MIARLKKSVKTGTFIWSHERVLNNLVAKQRMQNIIDYKVNFQIQMLFSNTNVIFICKCHIHINKSHFHYKYHEQMSFHKQIKKKGKDQESIQSSTTPDPGYQWGKWQCHN